MEEKKKITSSDKLPGCERLTRPEEISALSKYLGAIRKTQEDWIEDNMPDKPLDVQIKDSNKVLSLPDSVIGLDDETRTELPKTVDKIHPAEDKIIQDVSKLKVDEKVSAIPKDIIKIGSDKEVEIPKTKERLENNNQPESLPYGVIGISDERNTRLPKKVVGIGDVIDDIESLPDGVIGLRDDTKIDLPGGNIKINPDLDTTLPEEKERIPNEVLDPSLPINKEKRPGEEVDIKIPADKEKIHPTETNKLPADKKRRPGEDKDTPLPNTKISPSRPVNYVSSLPEILSKPDISSKDIDDYVKTRKNDELYTDIIDTLTLEANGKVNDGNVKLAGLLSALLGKDEMTESQIKGAAQSLFQYFQTTKALINAAVIDYPEKRESTEGQTQVNLESIDTKKQVKRGGEDKVADREKLKDELPDRVPYSLPQGIDLGYANPNTYLRQLAELATYGSSGQGWFGKDNSGLSGLGRRTLLETTLKAMFVTRQWAETKLGTWRGRLPGEDNSNKLQSVGSKVVGKIKSGINATQSLINGQVLSGVKEAADLFNTSDIKNRPTSIAKDSDGKKIKKVESGISLNRALFGDDKNNFTAIGTSITLQDLCNEADINSISSIDQLKEELRKSPYITTPMKYIKSLGAKNNITLDTNAYWEVIIEPLCDQSLNGGWSFLPSIHEINAENSMIHGVDTYYDKWIPLSNVELQKSKLTSKTLGLYDGEISYPVSVEYTNELRMTVIDDQYKSWRRYFQKCADVSVYSSEAHSSNWYRERRESSSRSYFKARPTAIDKSKFCIAYYKNITFRVRLYFMTPQYSTIKKFDLLCVMKDFSEEYYGDIDAGSQDLNISFSIVGENPEDNNLQYKIDKNGVGGWIYETEGGQIYLGTDVNNSILQTEQNISKREDQAAQKNKNKNNEERKKESATNPKKETPIPRDTIAGNLVFNNGKANIVSFLNS